LTKKNDALEKEVKLGGEPLRRNKAVLVWIYSHHPIRRHCSNALGRRANKAAEFPIRMYHIS